MKNLLSLKELIDGIGQLSEKYETWQKSKEQNEICLAHAVFNERIEYVEREGRIVAYAETWRVDHEQVKKILEGRFSPIWECVRSGPVLWIVAVTVDPEYRGDKEITCELKRKVFERNRDAEWIGGEYEGTRKREGRGHKLIPLRRHGERSLNRITVSDNADDTNDQTGTNA